MDDFTSYWGILVSLLTAGSAAVVYFVKNWRDVEALKEQRRLQDNQLAVLLEKVDRCQRAATEQEMQYRQAFEMKLQEHRADVAREVALLRRESKTATNRLHERLEALDKQLTVSVERQNQLLDSTRRQDQRNERMEKLLWSWPNARLNEE
ncbi:hypothetical protein J0X19_22615 [Hymenobacter sp. BT186]|uniref:DNA recombination protein RmuC n=1 Tax=Hymenobacter telluris TaxID=2816474 RepID=A0A939F0Z4_9BACT|nr:hypothetical protein [Hymenobacter telluris]MBO0360771.1 hypothetical protein [Hymenobacter telluris]MBW3376799.1 hypothetical protein [Hymenobacter norwichensis]